jgi:branched-chain amino acid aminotransferase
MQKTKKIWLNGKFVNWSRAKIHILTHTLHYGGGVFEGIRFYQTKKGPAIFRLKDHLKRLFYSARLLEMKVPFSQKEIERAIIKLIKINKIKEGYIRPLIYYGYGQMGLNPKKAPVEAAIIIWGWKSYLGEKPVKVKISKFIRIHPSSTYSQAKFCGHYLNSILATLEARNKGFNEALLLDWQGNIAEGPGENFFIVDARNRIVTPPQDNILPGITRKTVIKIAQDLGFRVEERKLKLEDLKKAKEAFFTGTAAEVTPIGQINRKIIASGKIGPITRILKVHYQRIVRGETFKYKKWLTFVE